MSWDLTHSQENFRLWKARRLRPASGGILLRSSAFVNFSARDVLLWLLRENLTLGIEGVITSQRVMTPADPGRGTDNVAESAMDRDAPAKVIVRRAFSAPFSFTTSKRDFIVVTKWGELDKHSYFVATRSVPNESYAKSKNYVRATVHCSGFIMRDIHKGSGVGCEVMHAVHASMSAKKRSDKARPSRFEQSKATELHRYMIKLVVDRMQMRKEILKTKGGGRGHWDPDWAPVLAPAPTPLSQSQFPPPSASVVMNLDSDLTPEQMTSINSAAWAVRSTLRDMHTTRQDQWTEFHTSDGISISELILEGGGKGMGTLMATCSVMAPPSAVRQLLVDQPASLDGLLENRSLLARVTPQTSVQWLAYGAIWPIGSRDFLVVTTEEIVKASVGSPVGDGFMLVSKSIDDICEDVEYDREEGGWSGSEEWGSTDLKTPSRLAPFTDVLSLSGSDAESVDHSRMGTHHRNSNVSHNSDTSDDALLIMGSTAMDPGSSARYKSYHGPKDQHQRIRLDSQLSEHLDGLIAQAGSGTHRRPHHTGPSADVGPEDDGDVPSLQYTRSNLRIAGYVGMPSTTTHGATDVFLYVDVDVYDFVPAWLLKTLAQYGLTEIMSRIRSICSNTESGEGCESSASGPPMKGSLAPQDNKKQDLEGLKRSRSNSATTPPTSGVSSDGSGHKVSSTSSNTRVDDTQPPASPFGGDEVVEKEEEEEEGRRLCGNSTHTWA
jgi:hypothetical protein